MGHPEKKREISKKNLGIKEAPGETGDVKQVRYTEMEKRLKKHVIEHRLIEAD